MHRPTALDPPEADPRPEASRAHVAPVAAFVDMSDRLASVVMRPNPDHHAQDR